MLVVDGFRATTEDVIASDHIEPYRKERDTIYDQLIWVNANIFIMERIISFPFGMFTHPSGTMFWSLANKAFFDSTITAIYTVVAEGGHDFALPVFKGKIIQKLRPDIDPKVKKQLLKQLKDVDFDGQIPQLREKIKEVRNRFIAHLDYKTKMRIDTTQYTIALDELRRAVSIAHKLLEALNFDTVTTLDFIGYQPNEAEKFGTDIDGLLAFVASRSFLLRQYRNEDKVARQREEFNRLTEDEQRIVETWRERVSKLKGGGIK